LAGSRRGQSGFRDVALRYVRIDWQIALVIVAKPGLIRFHYFSGMDSLAHVMSKARRYFFAATNVSMVSIHLKRISFHSNAMQNGHVSFYRFKNQPIEIDFH
jgi:hypothetical protein